MIWFDLGFDFPFMKIKILAQVSLEHAIAIIRLEGLNAPKNQPIGIVVKLLKKTNNI
jgi:hypothetical protein